jgi:hypothetical protein
VFGNVVVVVVVEEEEDNGGWIELDAGVACKDGNIEFAKVAKSEVGAVEIGANSFVFVNVELRFDADEAVSLVGT